MADTLDSPTGTWTLWVRTKAQPATATYQASFVASATDPSKGTVTVTAGGASYTGSWEETQSVLDENVNFQLQDFAGSNSEARFSGHMVGLAMGGTIGFELLPSGAWAAYKTGD